MDVSSTKTLVLVRHGKAQAPASDLPDDQRTLTGGAAISLARWLPHVLELVRSSYRWPPSSPRGTSSQGVSTSDDIVIWTSPAARTRQTASLIAEALSLPDQARVCDFLYDQDFDALIDQLRKERHSTIVAVGHEPFVSQTTERLSGCRIDFSPGSIAMLSVDVEALACHGDEAGDPCDEPASDGCAADAGPSAEESQRDVRDHAARLLLFARAPRSRRWETLASLAQALGRCAARVRNAQARFLAQPDDVEALHELRVSIRTLRSLVAFCAPYQRRKENRAVQRGLRDAVRQTSTLRELDVLIARVDALESPSPELRDMLMGMRVEERDRTLRELSGKKVAPAFARACDRAESPRWRRRYLEEGLPAKAVREHFARMRADMEQALAMVDLSDAEATHDVRKQAKRVRYVAENLPDVVGSDAAQAARRMKREQTRLGALCDARVNLRIIDGLPTENLSAQSLANLRALRQDSLDAIASFISKTAETDA